MGQQLELDTQDTPVPLAYMDSPICQACPLSSLLRSCLMEFINELAQFVWEAVFQHPEG